MRPMLADLAKRLRRRLFAVLQPPKPFPGSAKYWEERYENEGNSSVGSYGKFAAFKAEVINAFVADRGVKSVVEFSCGDGNQLILARYQRYAGYDVSETAVHGCRRLFAGDLTKKFELRARRLHDARGRCARAELREATQRHGMLKQLLKSQLSGGARQACRQLLWELRMQRAHRRSVRKARHLMPPLKLHIGCGTNLKPGWINIDLLEATADLQLDLREGLPFPTASVIIIHSEHFLEHLDFSDQVDQLLRESYRVLMPHGVFSVGIPEAGGLILAYARGEREVFAAQWNPDYSEWLSMPMHRINYLFRQFGEPKYAYDEETLLWTRGRAGFEKVSRRPFGPAMDTERRRNHTMYASGIKPAD